MADDILAWGNVGTIEAVKTWTPLWFSKGRHKGKTLPRIVLSDPDWFFWAYDEGVFENKGDRLRREAREVFDKSTHIKIPKPDPKNWTVEYDIHPGVGKFLRFSVVKKTHPRHAGSTPTLRDDCIDMSYSWHIKGYDNMGGKLFIKSLKYYVFGSSNYRFSKKRCEDFFNDTRIFTVSRSSEWRKRNPSPSSPWGF